MSKIFITSLLIVFLFPVYFHKNRDNVEKAQAAFIYNPKQGINKFIAVSDAIAMPLAIGAGTLLAASVILVDNGFLKWLMSIVIGGGTGSIIHGINPLI